VSASRWIATAGAACLAAGPVGQFVQYLVSPIDEGVSAYAQVAQAAAHLARMRWAIPLDLFILLVAPAVLYAGSLAGARVSKLAAAAAGLVFASWLSAGYLFGSDILLYLAATAQDEKAAAPLVDGYLSYPVVEGVVVAYLVESYGRVPAAWRGTVASASRPGVGGGRRSCVALPRGARRGKRHSRAGRRGFCRARCRVRRMRGCGCPSGGWSTRIGQSVQHRVCGPGGNLTAISFADG
jgi:hypothetical protein